MNTTTIKLQQDTKVLLDNFREYKNESYDEVVKKIVYIVKNPELSKETIAAIESARERMRRGKFLTEQEARKRLGMKM